MNACMQVLHERVYATFYNKTSNRCNSSLDVKKHSLRDGFMNLDCHSNVGNCGFVF